jgi:hypothetical protein
VLDRLFAISFGFRKDVILIAVSRISGQHITTQVESLLEIDGEGVDISQAGVRDP